MKWGGLRQGIQALVLSVAVSTAAAQSGDPAGRSQLLDEAGQLLAAERAAEALALLDSRQSQYAGGAEFDLLHARARLLAREQLLSVARYQLATDRAAEALAQLRGGELVYAGEPEFDLLYARAAMAAGEPEEGLAALQRVVNVDPRNAEAWMALAQVDASQGRDQALWRKLIRLQDMSPPPAAQQQLRRWLSQLGIAEAQASRLALGWQAGVDTNANLGTGLDSFGGIPVDQPSRSQRSDFTLATLQAYQLMHQRWPDSQRLGLKIQRREFGEDLESQVTALASAQRSRTWADHDWTVGLSGGLYSTASDTVRTLATQLGRGWFVAPGVRWQLLLGIGMLDFDVGNADRSRLRYSLGLGWRQRAPARRHAAGARLSAYLEDPEQADSTYASEGGRLDGHLGWSPLARLNLQLFLGLDYRHYRRDSDFFSGQRRIDRSGECGGKLAWRLWPRSGLAFELQARLQSRRSSLEIFDYDRGLVSAGLSWSPQ